MFSMRHGLTRHFVLALLVGVALIPAARTFACVPRPADASREVQYAKAVFVGRVVAVEQSDPSACIAAARSRQPILYPGYDAGEAECEAFGWATLDPIRFIQNDGAVSGPFRVTWNSMVSCGTGWVAEVGELAIAIVPREEGPDNEGPTAYVNGALQYDPLVRTILDLVESSSP
jgi:hypothetical protein